MIVKIRIESKAEDPPSRRDFTHQGSSEQMTRKKQEAKRAKRAKEREQKQRNGSKNT